MKTKLKDVAEKAGVSLATASLALAGKGRISRDVRAKVIQAAKDLGYKRKDKSADIQNNRVHTIGILLYVDDIWAFIWVFIRPIIEEIDRIMKNQGINTVILPIHHNSSRQEIIEKVQKANVQALISIHYGDESVFNSLEEMNIPVVIAVNNDFQDKFYSVCVDDFQCAYEGTMHLVKLGHKHLCYIACDRPDLPALLNDRNFGFRKALEESKIIFPHENRIHFDLNNLSQLKRKLEPLFKKAKPPTGIFCLDDDIAFRVIRVLEELGLSVPDDVSVIAPGDVLDYELPHIPKITTMKINTTYMGTIICQMLMNRIRHNPEDLHVLKVKHQLVKRGTCAPVKENLQ